MKWPFGMAYLPLWGKAYLSLWDKAHLSLGYQLWPEKFDKD